VLALVVAVLAAGAALAAAPPAPAAASLGSSASPVPGQAPPAAPDAVAAGLGIKGIPTELVILVDISQSMAASRHGLYPQVQQELPLFMSALAKQEPQDTVGVVVFGAPADTQTIYLGPPSGNVPLPATANSDGTDFGAAFKQAVNILNQAPANVQVGGVLLLSDGELYAPDDTEYGTYQAPGWQKLRSRVASMSIPVTGYGLPLTTDQKVISGLNQALGAVFGRRQLLTRYVGDLGAELGLAQQEVYDSKVTSAAQPDNGRGIHVTWSGLPGTGGAPPLSLSAGQCTVWVKLTATTQRIPLNVDKLSVTSTGLPVTMTGKLPATDRVLKPGQSITLPVHLRWDGAPTGSSLTGGSRSAQGRLELAGNVYSTYTEAIRGNYGYSTFSTGGLADATSSEFSATAATGVNVILWLVLLFAVATALAITGGMRARLDGSLRLTSVDEAGNTLPLPRLPRATTRTYDLIGIPGWLTVWGSPFSRTMRITLRLDNRPQGRGSLRPGGRTMIAGIDVVHFDPGTEQRRPSMDSRWE
jgi:hypothetical protein